MNLPHHDVWGGSSHGQVVYPQPDEQREIEHSFPESPAFPLGTPPSQDVNAEAFFPIVDPPPILACESGSSDSAFWGGAYAAFYNAVPPSRRQTYPIPLVPRLPFQGVTSDDSVPNRRALTIPVPSRAAPYTHLTFGGSPPDPFPHSGSSQAPVYGTNFVSSPTSVSQDQPLPQTGEESVSPGPITSLGNSRVDHIPTHLSFFGLPLTPPDGVPQQVSILVPSPSADRDLPPPSQRKHRARAPRRRPSTSSRGPRAQLSVGASVVYGNGCRLNRAALCGPDAVFPADYDAVALPGQTFGQKVSFLLRFEPYTPFTRQLHILQGGSQPTKRRLAKVAFLFVEYFIKDCEAHGQTPPFRLEDVVLRRIEVVSRSRIQLIIDVMGPAN